jgi:formate-dependent nitrite reductase membrane component NrfD
VITIASNAAEMSQKMHPQITSNAMHIGILLPFIVALGPRERRGSKARTVAAAVLDLVSVVSVTISRLFNRWSDLLDIVAFSAAAVPEL